MQVVRAAAEGSGLGVENVELRRYGTPAEHRAAHGLDAGGIKASLAAFLA